MITVPFARDRALRWTGAAVALLALVWYAQRYRPEASAVDSREAAAGAREARVQSARAALVVLGPVGLDSVLRQLSVDSADLALRMPAPGSAAAVAAEVKETLARAERDFGLRVAASEPLPSVVEGAFQADGYALKVVGRYSDIGALLARIGSMPRVTRVRALRLHAIPDSLVRTSVPVGAAGAGAVPAYNDSTGAATALGDAGAAPFTAVATFSLIWYTLPSSRAASDTSSVPSSFAPQDQQ